LNAIQPEIIPSSQIKLHPKNAFEKIENHTLAIQAAKKLGCSTVNIGPEDLLQGKVFSLSPPPSPLPFIIILFNV
jgi:Calponin homology (CH) domain